MQASLGRRGDYSIRATMDLALHVGKGRRKTREIAAEMDIPERYLRQILAMLVREGFLTAVAGPTGGYELARPPSEVTLLDIVEAAEGPVRRDACALRGGACDWDDVCPLHDSWARAQNALATELARTTFGDLVAVHEAILGGTYIPETPGHRGRMGGLIPDHPVQT